MAAQKDVINILLLGETGVGKSTMINALVNYLSYDKLADASKKELLYFIPTSFEIMDDNFQQKKISIGQSNNENPLPGASATQNPMTYLLELKDVTVRLIDTPGIGDTRGIKYDESNVENVMNLISGLDYLNAICIILKPNNSRLTALFNYCIKNVLARLDKSISNNICFLYTNTRSTFYRPGDSHKLLQRLLKEISSSPPYVVIPYTQENTFFVDNESIRYLMALKHGISFTNSEREDYEASWVKSSTEYRRMITYVRGLLPVSLQGTLTMNESRKIITILAKPVSEIVVQFKKAITRLQYHEEDLKSNKGTLVELKNKLYIPVTNYKVVKTIVTRQTHTKGWGSGVEVGATPRIPFVSFNFGYQDVTETTTETQETIVPEEKIVEDINVKSQIVTREDALIAGARKVQELNELISKYSSEVDAIILAAVLFSTFLKENSIVIYVDAFEDYFQQLINSEHDRGDQADMKLLHNFEQLLDQYKMKKNDIQNVTPQQIYDIMITLFNLEYSGTQLRELYEKSHTYKDNVVYSMTT